MNWCMSLSWCLQQQKSLQQQHQQDFNCKSNINPLGLFKLKLSLIHYKLVQINKLNESIEWTTTNHINIKHSIETLKMMMFMRFEYEINLNFYMK